MYFSSDDEDINSQITHIPPLQPELEVDKAITLRKAKGWKKTAAGKSYGGTGRFTWTNVMIEDMFGIIMSSDLLKQKLLLENFGNATKQYYDTVTKDLNL